MRPAIYIGGNFTELVLKKDGAYHTVRELTTLDCPTDGLILGVDQILEQAGMKADSIKLVVDGTNEAGQAIDVRDPMADQLKVAARSADPVTALLSIEAIFGSDLAGNADVVAAIQSAYQQLLADGAAKTVRAYLEQTPLMQC